MMEVPSVNLAAVAVCAAFSMVLGMLWYGPLFGKKWMELTGKKMGDMGNKAEMPKLMGVAFIGTLVAAYVLAIFIKFSGAATPVEGVMAGFWAWLGFIATVSLSTVLWEGKPVRLYMLNNAHELVHFAGMGAIIAAMA